MQTKLLIYGSYGYTGNLICEIAAKKGWKPTIAGRNAEKVKEQAEKFGFPYVVFDISETEKLEAELKKVQVVLHCAGPFMFTAKQMAEACLKTKTHYLDITGEWQVFEMLAGMDDKAKAAEIMILPGVGFDVVPSDCLALFLKESLPDATNLEIVLNNAGSTMSRGTKLTMAEGLGGDSAMRKEGKIIAVPLARFVKEITINGKKRTAMSIPWGDIATAWYSTQIPNITTYITAHPKSIRAAQRAKYIGFLLRIPFVKQMIKNRIYKEGTPITEEMRQKSSSQIWGSVQNSKGESKTALLTMPDGYLLTANTAVLIVERVLQNDLKIGFQTPAKCYGSGLILEADGTKREEL